VTTELEDAEALWAQGFVGGLYQMAVLNDGALGSPVDYAKRNECLRGAAMLGYGPALNNLGWNYRIGLGIEKNARLALHWFRLAALQWSPLAMQNVAEMLEAGEGVDKDPASAAMIFVRTAILDLDALEKIATIESGSSNAIAECRLKVGLMYSVGQLRCSMPARPLGLVLVRMAATGNSDLDADGDIGKRARQSQANAEEALALLDRTVSKEDKEIALAMEREWPNGVFRLREMTPLPKILLQDLR